VTKRPTRGPIVPGEGVIAQPIEMRAFETDGLTAYRQMPLVVVLPETTAQVSEVLKYAHDNGIKVVPRGAGTSLSGGALPLADGILLGMAKFNRVLEIDFANRCAVVQPGVTNLAITKAVEHKGFYYAPDPSSQIACTIGGNVAENSGGVHCLKYGLTTNNILGIEMVLIDGEIIRLGGKHLDSEGYDLLGLMTGSEGLLGVVTEVTVRILQKPETARAVLVGFPTQRGWRPMRGRCHCGRHHSGRHGDDGQARHPRRRRLRPLRLSARCRSAAHHRTRRAASRSRSPDRAGEEDRRGTTALDLEDLDQRGRAHAFWAGRKAAFPAVGRISPDYICMDGTIPASACRRCCAAWKSCRASMACASPTSFTPGTATCIP
jgi:glycolate oxidase